MKKGGRQATVGDVCSLVKGRKPVLSSAAGSGRMPYLVARFLRGTEPPEYAAVSDRNSVPVRADQIIVICDGSNSGETFTGFDGILSSTMARIEHNSEVLTKYLRHFLHSVFETLNESMTGSAIPHLDLVALRNHPIPLPPLPEQQRIVGILDEALAGLATSEANAEKNLRNARGLFDSYQDAVFGQRSIDWKETTVKQLVDAGVLAKPQDGNHGEIHPVRADFVATGVPFIMAADLQDGQVNLTDCRFITDKQARSLRIGFAKDGDVLLSHKGTIGRVAVLKTPSDQEFVILTPQVTYYRILEPKKLFPEYLPCYFRSPSFQKCINDIAGGGSTRAYIGITRQLSLPIVVPPLDQQKAIAKKLGELEAETQRLESLYQQKLAALDALKKSLMHEAFSGQLTSVVPVYAK